MTRRYSDKAAVSDKAAISDKAAVRIPEAK